MGARVSREFFWSKLVKISQNWSKLEAVILLFSEAPLLHEFGNIGAGVVHQAKGVFDFPAALRAQSCWGATKEPGADVGALRPGLEFFFLLLSGVGLFEGEPLALDGELLGMEVPAALGGRCQRRVRGAGPSGPWAGARRRRATGRRRRSRGRPTGRAWR